MDFLDHVRLPCPEGLWRAESGEQWNSLAQTSKQPPLLQTHISAIFAGESHSCEPFVSLCLITAISASAHDIRTTCSISPEDLHECLKCATRTWAMGSMLDHQDIPLAGILSLLMCDYLRISITIDLPGIMSCFVRCDFQTMQQKCGEGNLSTAGYESQSALRRWITYPNRRLSIILIPCGKPRTDFT